MEFVPVPNTARIDFVMLWSGQYVVNTLSVEHSEAITPADLSALTITARDLWETHLAPQHGNEIQLILVRATDLTEQSSPGYELPVSPAIRGEIMVECAPANVSLAYSFVTPLRGRSYRGRWYFVGIPQTYIDANVITTAYVDSTILAFGELFSALILEDWQPVIVSRWHNKAQRTQGVTTPISGVRSDYIVDSQRRRLPGRGK